MPIPPIQIEPAPQGGGFIRLTYTCFLCLQPCQLDVDEEKYNRWRDTGADVQHVFPDLSVSEREVLVSGSHGKCFDEAFAEPEDEEGDDEEDSDPDADPHDEHVGLDLPGGYGS